MASTQTKGLVEDVPGVEKRLGTVIRAGNESIVGLLKARPECNSAKLMQVVQDLDAWVHGLEQRFSCFASAKEDKLIIEGLEA